jgi:hypothetical protein
MFNTKKNQLIYCRGFPYIDYIHNNIEDNENTLFPRYVEILKYDKSSNFHKDYFCELSRNIFSLRDIRNICIKVLKKERYYNKYLYYNFSNSINNMSHTFICHKCYNIYYSKYLLLNKLLEYPKEIKEAIIFASLDIFIYNNIDLKNPENIIKIKQFNNPIYNYIDSFLLIME